MQPAAVWPGLALLGRCLLSTANWLQWQQSDPDPASGTAEPSAVFEPEHVADAAASNTTSDRPAEPPVQTGVAAGRPASSYVAEMLARHCTPDMAVRNCQVFLARDMERQLGGVVQWAMAAAAESHLTTAVQLIPAGRDVCRVVGETAQQQNAASALGPRVTARYTPAADAVQAARIAIGRSPGPLFTSTAGQAVLTELQQHLQSLGGVLTSFAFPHACNNPACSNLSGPSEARLVGGRSCVCAGCLTARYCGRACQRANWRQHKPVCKGLAAAAAGVAPAAAEAGSGATG